tara:strand:+ start:1377 stop:1610 length:234 start_codon:yes stop_codon:yes gene_type:complete
MKIKSAIVSIKAAVATTATFISDTLSFCFALCLSNLTRVTLFTPRGGDIILQFLALVKLRKSFFFLTFGAPLGMIRV